MTPIAERQKARVQALLDAAAGQVDVLIGGFNELLIPGWASDELIETWMRYRQATNKAYTAFAYAGVLGNTPEELTASEFAKDWAFVALKSARGEFRRLLIEHGFEVADELPN